VGACPVELFFMQDSGKAQFKIEKKDECVHCEACVGACPASAISIKDS
jgi:NAD-dependent dihydropyrimidine dehydrogenase PreA subunit